MVMITVEFSIHLDVLTSLPVLNSTNKVLLAEAICFIREVDLFR